MSAITLSSLTLALAMQPATPEPTQATPAAPTQPTSQPAASPAPAQPSPATSAQAATPAPQSLPTETAPPAAQAGPAPEPTPEASTTAPAPPHTQTLSTPELKTPMGTAWGVGVSAGTTAGIGITARRHFENRVGVHFGGIYIYSDETHWGNLGGQLLYTFARSKKTRLYGLLGAQFVLNHSKETQYDFSGVTRTVGVTNSTLFVGPGVGLEIHFTKHFGWALEVPTAFVFALEGDKHRLPMGGVVNFIPAANTSFTFYFK